MTQSADATQLSTDQLSADAPTPPDTAHDTEPSLSTTVAPHQLTLRDGALEMPALMWVAEGANDATRPVAPALVVLPDFYGFDEAFQSAAARLCGLGYTVLAPDLTAQTDLPTPDAAPSDLDDWVLKQSDAANVKKALSALGFLRAQEVVDPERLGILGWGWSGALALMAAGHGDALRVVCDIGGTITYPVLTANRPGSPLNFLADVEAVIFAAFAGQDLAFPDDEIRRLRTHIVDNAKNGEVKSYDAPARFWRNDTLPQTQAFWRRLGNFLAENLAGTRAGIEPLGEYPNQEARIQA